MSNIMRKINRFWSVISEWVTLTIASFLIIALLFHWIVSPIESLNNVMTQEEFFIIMIFLLTMNCTKSRRNDE